MAEVARDALRLLVVPDRRTLLSTSGVGLTATSEAGPRPGIVAAAQASQAIFAASGTLDSDLAAIEVTVARSGGPGAVELRWRHAAESVRSWDPPTAISEFEFIDRDVGGGKYAAPHACRLASGLLVVVVSDASAAITCFRQAASGKWSSSTVATRANSRGAVAVLSSGRLICCYLAGNSGTTQVHMAYSDDDGATWTVGSTTCLDTPLAETITDLTRIRMCVIGSELLLVVWGYGRSLYQLASLDGGATFDLIDTIDASNHRASDVTSCAGVGYWAYVTTQAPGAPDPARQRPYVARLSTARTKLSTLAAVYAWSGSHTDWDDGAGGEEELAIVGDDDGTVWLYGRDANVAGGSFREVIITRSIDDGATWDPPFISSANAHGLCVNSWGVATSYLVDICAVPERGRVVLLSRAVAVTANDGDSLMATYLGGWSTVGLPSDATEARMSDVGGWDLSWLCFEKPDNIGWGLSTAGAPMAILGSAGLLLTCGGGENITYNPAGYSIAAAPNAGILMSGQVRVDSGTATVELRISDGTHDFSVRLEITTTGLRIYDKEAAAYVAAATATTDPQNGVAFLLCVDAPSAYGVATGRVRCYYRPAGNYTFFGPKADRQWTAVTGSTTLVRGGTATSLVQWGQAIAAAGASCWRWVGVSGGVWVAGGDGLADPTRGRQASGRASPVHIEKGLRIAAVSGTALRGEVWNHATSHDYPASAVDPTQQPSPRRTWRSTDDGTQQDLTWTIDGGWRAGDLVALYLGGCNWRTAGLYRGAGAATKVMDIDLGITGLDFVRSRDLLYSAHTGVALPWYAREGVLDGSTFALSGAIRRKVRHNRGGMWPNVAGTFPHCELEISGYDGADPASGTGELWLPQGLFLTTLMQATDTLTLRLAADVTADGYHETGVAMVGRAVGLGIEYGWGRADEVASSVDLKTLLGGARRARQLAEIRRAVEIAWGDGVDELGLYSAAAPNYVSIYTGGAAHGDVLGTLPQIAGLLGELGGSASPAVLCMRAPTQGSAPTAGAPIRVIDPAALLYGRAMTELWRRDNVLGEEFADPGEVTRGGVLRFEQEL